MSEKDGGTAFPCFQEIAQWDDDAGKYRDVMVTVGGMSLRDYFAGQALILCGALARVQRATQEDIPAAAIALTAYQVADAMLVERAK